MYLLFRYHHITPSDYYSRKSGEKRILRAFIRKEIEDKQKAIEALESEVR